MLKRSTGERAIQWLAYAYFGCVLFVGWSAWLSEAATVCHDEQHNQYKANTNQESCSSLYVALIIETRFTRQAIRLFLDENKDAIGELATVVIALFTATLWLTSRNQLRELKRSVDLANNEFIATKRAFISLERFTVDARKGGKLRYDRFDLTPIWRNSGTTPTEGLEVSINFRKHQGNLPVSFEYPYADKPAPIFIGPQSTERGEKREVPAAFINEVIDDAAYFVGGALPHQFFIWGRAKYRTILGDGDFHICDWCYRVEFSSLNADDLTYSFVQWGSYNRSYKEGRTY
jgi:hypothetical protein